MRSLLLLGVRGALCGLFALILSGCPKHTQKPIPPQEGPFLASSGPVEPPKPPTLLTVARSQVGVLESPLNSNRGERVDEYNLTCGKDYLGGPWCASFARWCFYQTGQTNGIPGAYSPDWFSKARKVAREDVRPGDQGLIYFNSLGRYAHTIACVEEVKLRGIKPVEVVCIEGNSNPDGGREGYGVFRRIRSVDSVTFMRWSNP